MKVIGLTGGIGSGKSTVSQILAELGAVVIDADIIGHEILKPDTDTWQEVVDTFGKQVLNPKGEIDRANLGKMVFENPENRLTLNRIMHAKIHREFTSRIEEYRRKGVDVVVLEAALLLEVDLPRVITEVWVVIAPEEAILKRMMAERGMTREQAQTRIRSQISNEERTKHADIVINNDKDIATLREKVRQLWQRLHN
jgi:dephospho-CoA kinase